MTPGSFGGGGGGGSSDTTTPETRYFFWLALAMNCKRLKERKSLMENLPPVDSVGKLTAG